MAELNRFSGVVMRFIGIVMRFSGVTMRLPEKPPQECTLGGIHTGRFVDAKTICGCYASNALVMNEANQKDLFMTRRK